MPKKKQTGQNLTLVEWCDQQVAEGKELKIVWNGGNDSGWVHFELDGQDIENEYTEKIVNFMYNYLDYGSWAGEFEANGEAIYDSVEKAFVGIDYYSEDSSIDWEVEAEIRVPKKLWFDNFLFTIDGYDTPEAEFRFFVKNGFLTPEHDEVLKHNQSKMNDVIDDAIEEFENKHQFRGIWESTNIPRADFEEDGEDLVCKITHIQIGTTDGTEKDICLHVGDAEGYVTEN